MKLADRQRITDGDDRLTAVGDRIARVREQADRCDHALDRLAVAREDRQDDPGLIVVARCQSDRQITPDQGLDRLPRLKADAH